MLYKVALRGGIKPFEFWDYTVQEVADILGAYEENEKQKMQFIALCSYNQGMIVVSGVNNMFSKTPKQPHQLWEVYPTLFEKPIEQIKQQKEEIMKARLLAYNEAWKKKHRKG